MSPTSPMMPFNPECTFLAINSILVEPHKVGSNDKIQMYNKYVLLETNCICCLTLHTVIK